MQLPWRKERRNPGRSADPLCPQCQGALVRVTVRTAEVLMYRCDACDEAWNVPKPVVSTDDPPR
jgi:hypothetical protein